MFVYTIQPVVKPVVSPNVQPGLTTVLNEQLFVQHGCQTVFVKPVCQTRFDNRLNTRLSNRLTGLTTGCIVYTNIQPLSNRVCQTGCTTRFDNRLNEPLFVQHGCQTGCQTRLSTFWQPVGCLFTRYSRLSYRLYNRFDNRLYRVNGVLQLHCTSAARQARSCRTQARRNTLIIGPLVWSWMSWGQASHQKTGATVPSTTHRWGGDSLAPAVRHAASILRTTGM